MCIIIMKEIKKQHSKRGGLYGYKEGMGVNGRFSGNMVKRGNRLIVYVPRELDHHFAEQITETLDQELEKGIVRQLVFDFSATTFMDSSGIGMIMGRKRLLSCCGGTVSAIHVNDRIWRIMQLSGIYKHIEISQEAVWNRKMR